MTGSQSPIGGAAENSVVQKVRRFHRRWREDRAGWHEHVGRSSAILAAMRAAITPPRQALLAQGGRCDTYCVEVGPLRVCDRGRD